MTTALLSSRRDYRASRDRTVYTTGQIAKLCHVAPRTVSKWFDSGKLRGYRIPGSNDRRVPLENLVKFLSDNGMPLGCLEQRLRPKALLYGFGEGDFSCFPGGDLPASLREHGVESIVKDDPFTAGMSVAEDVPLAVVVSPYAPRDDAKKLVAAVRCGDRPYRFLAALVPEDSQESDYHGGEYDAVFPFPWRAGDIAPAVGEGIRRVLAG